MMHSIGSQQFPVHDYILNVYISMYQDTVLAIKIAIVINIKIAEAQASSFNLLYLSNTSVYNYSFICLHVSVISEELSSLFSLQVMITFSKVQNWIALEKLSQSVFSPQLTNILRDKYV